MSTQIYPPSRPLLFGILIAFVSLGCQKTAPSQATETPALERAQADFDIEATMTELAAVLEERSELLQEMMSDPQAFTRSKADLVSQTYFNERQLVTRIGMHLQEDPRWPRSICQWYDSIIRAPLEKAILAMKTASDSKECGPDLAARLYGDDYSEWNRQIETNTAAMMFLHGIKRFEKEFPPSARIKAMENAGDIHVLCLKMRLIE